MAEGEGVRGERREMGSPGGRRVGFSGEEGEGRCGDGGVLVHSG